MHRASEIRCLWVKEGQAIGNDEVPQTSLPAPYLQSSTIPYHLGVTQHGNGLLLLLLT